MSIDSFPYNYVVFEGLFSEDKKLFIEKLSNKVNIKYVSNSNIHNPFLNDFFKDIESYAFQTQMFYLLSRYKQQNAELKQLDLFNKINVVDYLFERDNIFAFITLSNSEYKIYEQVYSSLVKQVPKPDLLVYFHSDTDDLLKKFRLCTEPYSKYISPNFIVALNENFNNYFFNYDNSPILIVETGKIDFKNFDEYFEKIFYQISNLRSAREYYNPLKERTIL